MDDPHSMPISSDAAPNLKPLFDMTLQAETVVAPISTPAGHRMVVRVTGGHFEGERICGTVLGGEDWISTSQDGIVRLDVRLSLRLEDGDAVLMRYTGLRHGPERVMTALSKGEMVDPKDYYFRVNCTFETASPTFSWLNRMIGVGSGARYPGHVTYSMWEVL